MIFIIHTKKYMSCNLTPSGFTVIKTMCRKYEFIVKGYAVLEQLCIGKDGSMKLQMGTDCINPSSIGLSDNCNETILSLNDILDNVIISHSIVCLSKQVPENNSNIEIILGNGQKYYGKSVASASVILQLHIGDVYVLNAYLSINRN